MRLSSVDFRLFAAIADYGGITSAARKLGLTKSLVSRELASLEKRLDTRLVQRTTRKVSLTDTGELLAAYARRVVEEMDNAEAAIEAMQGTPRGALKVSVPFSILRFVLVPRLGAFRRRYPDIRLSLDASTRIVDLVEEGIDVAIRIGELPDSSYVARRLALTPFVLVASRKYLDKKGAPHQPGDLLAHETMSLGRAAEPEIWTLATATGSAATVAISPSIAVHDPGLLLDLVKQDLGIAPIPLIYARDALALGDVERVLPQFTKGAAPIHSVYPSRRMLAPKAQAFIEFITSAMNAANGYESSIF